LVKEAFESAGEAVAAKATLVGTVKTKPNTNNVPSANRKAGLPAESRRKKGWVKESVCFHIISFFKIGCLLCPVDMRGVNANGDPCKNPVKSGCQGCQARYLYQG
jgi:hypothetical protein